MIAYSFRFSARFFRVIICERFKLFFLLGATLLGTIKKKEFAFLIWVENPLQELKIITHGSKLMESPLTREERISNYIFLVNRFLTSVFVSVAVIFMACCSGFRLDSELCRNCRGDACRLACGVCGGAGQLFVRDDLETCVWCHGSGRRWERVPVRRVEKQSDGSEKVLIRWVTRRVWCSHCGGRGSWKKRVFEACKPCQGSGSGEYPFVCAVCDGTGERTKGIKPERNWVEAP